MKKLICKCDRCGIEVKEDELFTIPNPTFLRNEYYAQNPPFAVYPRQWELCFACTEDLIFTIRKFCAHNNEP